MMDFIPGGWLDIAQASATGGVGLYAWLATRDKINEARIAVIEQRMDKLADDHETRLGRIEEGLKHVPTHSDISGLYKRIEAVHGDLREISGKMDALVGSHALVMQHMIEGRR